MRWRGVRRAGRAAFGVALVLVLVAAALLVAVSFGWQRERLRARLVAELASALGADVEIAGLEGPLHGEIVVRGVRVALEGEPLLEAEALRLRVAGFALGPPPTLELGLVALDAPRLWVERDASGRWNAEALGGAETETAASGSGPDWRVVVRRFAVNGGTVEASWPEPDAAEPSRVTLGVELEGSWLSLPWEGDARVATGARGRLTLASSQLAGVALAGGAAELGLDAGRASLAALHLEGPFGRLDAEAEAALLAWLDGDEDAAVQLELRFAELDLAALLARADLESALAGSARASLRPGSAGGPPSVALELTLEPSRSPFGRLESGRAVATLADGRWRLDEARLDAERAQLRASGEGPLADPGSFERLDLEADIAELGPFAALLAPQAEARARGSAQIRAALRGPLAHAQGEIRASGEKLAWAGIELGRLELAAEAREGRLRLDALALTGGDVSLSAEPGAVLGFAEGGVQIDGLRLRAGEQRVRIDGGLGPAGFTDVRVAARQLDLDFWGRLFAAGAELGGSVDLELAADGPFAAPELSGQGEWRTPRVGETRFEQLDFQLATRGSEVHGSGRLRAGGRPLVAFDASAPRAALADLTRVGADPAARLMLDAEDADLATLVALVGPATGIEASGRLDAHVVARGASPHPQLTGRIALDATRLVPARDSRGLAPIAVELRLEGDAAVVESLRFQIEGTEDVWSAEPGARLSLFGEEVAVEGLRLTSRDQLLAVEGRASAQRARALQLSLQALDVAALGALRAGSPPLGGVLDARLRLDGAWRAPHVEGELDWREPRVNGTPLDTVTLALEMRGETLHASGRVHGAGRDLLVLDGFAPVRVAFDPDRLRASPEAQLELRVDDLDLALLAPVLPRSVRKPRGSARGELRLRGGSPNLEVSGELAIVEGAVDIPLLARSFSPIEGRLSFRDDTLQIESLRIGVAGSSAELSGRIALAEAAPGAAELKLRLEHFPVSRARLLAADLDGELQVDGQLSAPRVRGALTLEKAVAHLPEPSDPTLKEIRVIGDDAGAAALTEGGDRRSPFERADLDVRLVVPPGSWVRGRGTQIELAGEVRLRRATRQQARYTGAMRTLRGRYQIHGRVFDVREGRATFDGGATPDPLLAVTAAHPVRDVEILARIGGRLSAPEIELASEPPLPDADVLAYLLFGRPANELGGAQQQAVQSAALQAAAGVAAGELGRLLADKLPVDSIDLRFDEAGGPGTLEIGKRVNDRVFVRYGRSFSGDANDAAYIELKLSPRWSLESEVSRDGSAGADVIWNRDY